MIVVPIVPGVRMRPEEVDAEFVRGSVHELARRVRDLLWTDLRLFADTELLIVHVGGDRPESREDPLEIESWQPGVPFETVAVPTVIFAGLIEARETNMPGAQYAQWACECEEYCDQDHGEGRIDLFVFRPNFHELAMSQNEALRHEQSLTHH